MVFRDVVVCMLIGGYQHFGEMLVTAYKSTQHPNQEDHSQHFNCCQGLVSQIYKTLFQLFQ